MTDKIKRDARARAAATGESYTRARRVVARKPATPADVPVVMRVARYALICPGRSEVWDTPANAGFDRAAIIARLDALRAAGHDYELIDGEALTGQERSDLYRQAFSALAHAGIATASVRYSAAAATAVAITSAPASPRYSSSRMASPLTSTRAKSATATRRSVPTSTRSGSSLCDKGR